jgi:hypothetical protein
MTVGMLVDDVAVTMTARRHGIEVDPGGPDRRLGVIAIGVVPGASGRRSGAIRGLAAARRLLLGPGSHRRGTRISCRGGR